MVRKIKYFVFAIICMCITPLITHAECDYQRLAELSRIASNVQFNYNYDLSQGLSFTLYVTNLTNDIYAVDAYGNRFSGAGEKSLVYSSADVTGFQNGDQVAFKFYSNDNNCKDEEIVTKYVNFPTYNPYSRFDICRQYPNFKYCQMWIDTSYLTYEEFEQELNASLSNATVTSEVPEENLYDSFLAFLNQPYIIIGTSIFLGLILFGVFILILQKRRRKKR